jgi:hypothetical protein
MTSAYPTLQLIQARVMRSDKRWQLYRDRNAFANSWGHLVFAGVEMLGVDVAGSTAMDGWMSAKKV